MALTTQSYPFVQEVVMSSAGSISANTSVNVTATIPAYFPTSSFCLATYAGSLQNGIAIGRAWISASTPGTGSTLSVQIINATAGALTPTGDPLTLKVVIL